MINIKVWQNRHKRYWLGIWVKIQKTAVWKFASIHRQKPFLFIRHPAVIHICHKSTWRPQDIHRHQPSDISPSDIYKHKWSANTRHPHRVNSSVWSSLCISCYLMVKSKRWHIIPVVCIGDARKGNPRPKLSDLVACGSLYITNYLTLWITIYY